MCSTLGFFNCREDLVIVRETVQGLLGKDQLLIDFHLEHPTARGDEFRFHLEFIPDGASQTGGAWFVVSNLAVFDGDLHEDPP